MQPGNWMRLLLENMALSGYKSATTSEKSQLLEYMYRTCAAEHPKTTDSARQPLQNADAYHKQQEQMFKIDQPLLLLIYAGYCCAPRQYMAVFPHGCTLRQKRKTTCRASHNKH
ncbi:uncharacterized protein LOC129585091 [Paramacrobiotus metropolitanus]|uniref:uncharacterized protein LOC129585091 n=1 Tax=Paramacrobiotus metropolitanus TaxID=2943436 RepID=UPI002446184B|nr:uncharacterized protein LOC129585091 [Paramacrobiotus metropolitanus]